MRRPRGKPKVPAEVQAEEVLAYARSICEARGPVQGAVRKAIGLNPSQLAKRTTLAAQSMHDSEKDDGIDSSLFMLAAVGRVCCGTFVRLARDIEKAAEKLRQKSATRTRGKHQAS